MTLNELAASVGTIVQVHPSTGCRYIVTDELYLQDAFHLSDYICSSRCGITFWFIPRY